MRGRGNAGVGVNIDEGAGENVVERRNVEGPGGLMVVLPCVDGVGASSDENVGSRTSLPEPWTLLACSVCVSVNCVMSCWSREIEGGAISSYVAGAR